MCGIFSAGSDGAILSTSPRIQPSPSVTTYSRPRSAMSCMPTQMPRNGRPLPRTVSSSASTMPGTASRPRRQSAKAPTPGSTTRSARRTVVGIARHHDRLIVPAFARGALERLGRRMQIARTVIDDRDAHGRKDHGRADHGRACGSGNRPMTSGDGGPASAWPAAAAAAAGRRRCRIAPPSDSKKRRSAALADWARPRGRRLVQRRRRRPAPQRSGFEADQQRDQERRRRTSPAPDTPSAQSAAWIAAVPAR